MSIPNTKVIFNAIPNKEPTLDTFKVISETIPNEIPAASVLIKTFWISLDPVSSYSTNEKYMRGRMREPGTKSYVDPFIIGSPFTGGAVGLVVKSNSLKYKAGEVVLGFFEWATYSIAHESQVQRVVTDSPDWIGKLGMPSLTAYYGLLKIGKPVGGETLFVSAAAGAVGQVVGQMGKVLGLRVVGSAGSDEKVAYLKDKLGFDGAFNYKTEDINHELSRLCPKGIDIYFENVGGVMLENVLAHMNKNGRIPTCGMISQYNEQSGVKNLFQIIAKRLTIQGFIVGDHISEIADEFFLWMKDNSKQFVYETTVAQGLSSIPEAFIGLMNGKNLGKQLVRV